MRVIRLAALALLALAVGCETYQPDGGQPEAAILAGRGTAPLNYEFTSQEYAGEVLDAHYGARVDLDRPFIIERPAEGLQASRLHRVHGARGTAVYLVELDAGGAISNPRVIAMAGLGLDEYAREILSRLRIMPGYQAGSSRPTECYIRITIRGREGP